MLHCEVLTTENSPSFAFSLVRLICDRAFRIVGLKPFWYLTHLRNWWKIHITTTTFWKWFQGLPDAQSPTTGCGARTPPQRPPTDVVAKLRFTQRHSWLTLPGLMPEVVAFLGRTSEDDITQRNGSNTGNVETHWQASKGFLLTVLGKINDFFARTQALLFLFLFFLLAYTCFTMLC